MIPRACVGVIFRFPKGFKGQQGACHFYRGSLILDSRSVFLINMWRENRHPKRKRPYLQGALSPPCIHSQYPLIIIRPIGYTLNTSVFLLLILLLSTVLLPVSDSPFQCLSHSLSFRCRGKMVAMKCVNGSSVIVTVNQALCHVALNSNECAFLRGLT